MWVEVAEAAEETATAFKVERADQGAAVVRAVREAELLYISPELQP